MSSSGSSGLDVPSTQLRHDVELVLADLLTTPFDNESQGLRVSFDVRSGPIESQSGRWLDFGFAPSEGDAHQIIFQVNGGSEVLDISPLDEQPYRLVRIADALQEQLIEESWRSVGAATPRPRCPLTGHGHPLQARLLHADAVWQCPTNRECRCSIGKYSQLVDSYAGGGTRS